MEKYKIVRKNRSTGDITMLSENGRIIHINENKLGDLFTKIAMTVKAGFVMYVKKAGRILTYIKDKFVNVTTPVQIAINSVKDKTISLIMNDEDENTVKELGGDYNKFNIDDFNEFDNSSFSNPNDFWIDVIKKNYVIAKNTLGKELTESEKRIYKRALNESAYFKNKFQHINEDEEDEIINNNTSLDAITRNPPLFMKGENTIDTKQLKQFVYSELKRMWRQEPQGLPFSRQADTLTTLVILGAPGIGKSCIITAVTSAINNALSKEEKQNTVEIKASSNEKTPNWLNKKSNFVSLNCSTLNKDQLSVTAVVDIETKKGEDVVKSKKAVSLNVSNVLPAYEISNDTELNKSADIALGCGCLFLDEITRINDVELGDALMDVLQKKSYNNMSLGTNWFIIAAGNRAVDMLVDGEQQTGRIFNILSETAHSNRMQIYTYVPTYPEWRKWAVRTNKETGEQNIHPLILSFLDSVSFLSKNESNVGRHLWYDNLTECQGGGANPRKWMEASKILYEYDNILKGKDEFDMNVIAGIDDDTYSEEIEDLFPSKEEAEKNLASKLKSAINQKTGELVYDFAKHNQNINLWDSVKYPEMSVGGEVGVKNLVRAIYKEMDNIENNKKTYTSGSTYLSLMGMSNKILKDMIDALLSKPLPSGVIYEGSSGQILINSKVFAQKYNEGDKDCSAFIETLSELYRCVLLLFNIGASAVIPMFNQMLSVRFKPSPLMWTIIEKNTMIKDISSIKNNYIVLIEDKGYDNTGIVVNKVKTIYDDFIKSFKNKK